MSLPNIFTPEVSSEIIERINKLTAITPANWGKMTVAQMLAHCNVTYEMIYEHKHPKPNFFMKFISKTLIKKIVTNETPYKRNSPTAAQFIIKDDKSFETEKNRLISHLNRTQELGETYFHNKESHSMGVLNKTEWNNMFYKHLNHHLTQFGV